MVCRQLVQSEPSRLTGRGLDAAARGCCAWLHGFSGTDPDLDAAARELLGNIWDEGFRAATLVGFPNTEALYAVLALYRIAYGPTVAASDYSLAEQCDALASSLLEHAAGRHSALDGREDDAILMHVAANLYCYLVPEDLEDDDIVESLRTIAGRWKEERSAPVDLLLQRLCALEAADGLFGEWRPALPPASAVAWKVFPPSSASWPAAWTTLRPSLRPARPWSGSCHCPRISPPSPPSWKGSVRCGC